MGTVYKSKTDIFLTIVIFAITAISLLPVLIINFTYTICILLFVLLAIESIVLFGIRYTIDEKQIKVTCCCYNVCIVDIANITHISKTRTIMSAPAAALDRIEIHYNGKSIVVSPQKKQEFINRLLEINKDISVG